MRIFVINLAARADRRESVARQLAGTGIAYEFFTAVEATDALAQHFAGRDNRVSIIELQRRGSPSEIACYASHLCLWKICVALNQPIVILEDDFAATTVFKPAIDFASQFIDQYGFIRLEPLQYRRKMAATTEPVPALETAEFTLYFQTTVSIRATGYAISPATAKRFIDASRKFTVPVDHFLQQVWIHQAPMFALVPPAIGLTSLADDSSILGRKTGRKHYLVHHLLRQVRKIYQAWAKRAARLTNEKLMREYPQLFCHAVSRRADAAYPDSSALKKKRTNLPEKNW